MQKISDSTNTANPAGEFTEGNPAAGVPATLLKAAWFNAIQRELVALVSGAGINLSASDDSQVLKAVKALAGVAADFTKLTNKPTTLGGYGISDAFTKTQTTTAIQQAIASLVASSPAALDTLNELAAALGNDPDFATTMTNALAAKANKATTLGGYSISDAYTKTQIDSSLSGKANKATTIAGYGITDALVVGSGGWLSAPPVVAGTIAAVPSSQLFSAVSPNTTDTPSSYPNTVGMHMIFANTSFGADIAVSLNDNIGNLLFRNLGPNASGWRKVWHDGNFALSSKISGDNCPVVGFNGPATAPYMRHTDGTYVALQIDRPKDTANFSASGFSKNADTGEIIQWMEVAIGDIPAGGKTVDITWPFAFPNAIVNVPSIAMRSADAATRHVSTAYYSMATVNGCRLQVDEAAQQVQPASLTAIVTARGR